MGIDFETVSKLIRADFDAGKMFWRERSADMFTDGARSAEGNCKAWNARFSGKETFLAVTNGYRTGCILSHQYYAHRIIWLLHAGDWPRADIDHINGDRSDNRLINLRAVSRSENLRNRGIPNNNTSGVLGVYFQNSARKWVAQIEVGGGAKILGLFDDKREAALARKAADIKYGFHENHGRKIVVSI